MARNDDTKMGGNNRNFPNTQWSILNAMKDSNILASEYKSILNILTRNYWKPVYCYLRRRGYSNEDAKDFVQEFFSFWVQRGLFARVDSTRGKFRTYMLTSLNNFVSNTHRSENAKKRKPEGGFVYIDDTQSDNKAPFEPEDGETPETTFHQIWLKDLLSRVIKKLQEECYATDKEKHFQIFLKRIIKPVLEGENSPSIKDLAIELKLTEKQTSNHLITAKRAFQRLLADEIKFYALSENEVSEEIQDLSNLFQKNYNIF